MRHSEPVQGYIFRIPGWEHIHVSKRTPCRQGGVRQGSRADIIAESAG